MPLQDIEGLYRGDGIFFFNLNDTLYAYTMYTANEEEAKNLASYSPYYNVDAIHIWKYTGTTAQAYRAIPDTTGKTFEWNGETYSYTLKQKVDEGTLGLIAEYILGIWSQGYYAISNYDYNLNGSIDREDLLYAVYLYGDSIYTLKGASVEATTYYNCLLYGCLSDLELDNIFINWNFPKGTFLDYSYICPVDGDMTCCWWASVGVYQILPDSFYDILYEDYGEPFEDGGDYIMYNREDWWTTSDYYNVTIVVVFQVDDDGNYVLERHPASDTLDSLQEN